MGDEILKELDVFYNDTNDAEKGFIKRMYIHLSSTWHELLASEIEQPYFQKLAHFVDEERQNNVVYPPETEVFSALELTPYEQVKVLLVGQDPYHDANQAHGLCFSVRPGIKPPPSLVNMFKELRSDLGCHIPNNGYLVPWAQQGVLMLNTVLTVREHTPNSHKNHGWERFTDTVIHKVNEKTQPVVFILWGAHAQQKRALIDTSRHHIVESAHPSHLSPRNGFFASQPFPA